MHDALLLTQRDLVFLDTETSSLDPIRGEILELAAIRLSPDLKTERAVLHRKTKLVHPEWAQAEALRINGYSPEAWRDAVDIRVALADYLSLVDSSVVAVGHNVRFDETFLIEAFRREQLVFPRTKYLLDMASLAWPLALKGHFDKLSLETLCAKYGISNVGQHTALADVRRTIAVYKKLLGMP